VKERGRKFHIGGVVNDKELSRRFSEKVRSVPTISPPLKTIPIPNSTKVLVVFHIPFSEEGPHVPMDEQRRIFWKRTNKGKVHMTYDEIRMAFQRIPYEERKKHSLYLSEILKKISVIGYKTKPDKTRSLQVPSDYKDYLANMSISLFSHGSEQPYPVSWIDIKYLDHLEWALSHLKHQEYLHIHQTWLDLNRLMVEYNQLVTKSISDITEIVRTHMKQDYPGFSEEPQEGHTDRFYLNNIFRLLFENYYFYILGKKSTDFHLQIIPINDSNSFQATFVEHEPMGGGLVGINRIVLIQSPSKEKLDINKLRQTLISICEDIELIKHFCNLNNKDIEIDKTRRQFKNQLNSLIKDIDAGYIMKGTCRLGY
jgi:hypothetical protein